MQILSTSWKTRHLAFVLCIGFLAVGCQSSVNNYVTGPSLFPSLGSSFGTDGIVRSRLTLNGNPSGESASATVIQPDGKILVAGSAYIERSDDFAVARYNVDGTLDTTFNSTGKVTTGLGTLTPDTVTSIALQSDGKILVAGFREVAGINDFAVVRYNSNGSLDTSFNSSGMVLTDIGSGSNDYALSITVQTDGKILVAGYSNASGNNDFTVVRYNTNGSLDTTFNLTGKVLTDIGTGTADLGKKIAVQSDGKILVAGNTNNAGSDDFALVRYNSDGSLDTSYNTTGKLLIDFGSPNENLRAMSLQSDGKVVLAGSVFSSGSYNYAVARCNSDGSFDTSLNTTGKVLTDLGAGSQDYVSGMALQTDNKIILIGESSVSSFNFTVVRYNTDGSLDTNFNSTGVLFTDIGTNTTDSSNALAVQANGNIIVAGFSVSSGPSDFAVVRYNTNGTLDTTFGSAGKALTDFGTSSSDFGYATAIQSDGKILVAAETNASGSYNFAVFRYNADGTLDTSFNSTGKVITDIGTLSIDTPYGIAVQSDGKIVAIGSTNASGSNNFAVVRYNSDGSLDTTFNSTGKVITDIGTNSNDLAKGVAIQTDGKIVVVGRSNAAGSNDFAVVRYNSNGSLDTTFNTTGKLTTDLGATSNDMAYGVAVQSDGKIVVAGSSNAAGSGDFALVRYTASGALDTTFNLTGKVTTDIGSGTYEEAVAMALQADGKILLTGFTDAAGTDDFAIVRYNTDGSLDSSFNSTGKATADLNAGSYDYAYAISVQPDGKIVLAGEAYTTSYPDVSLVRFNSNGTLDSTFNGTGLVNTTVGSQTDAGAYGLAVQSDGSLIAAGYAHPDLTNKDEVLVIRYKADGSR